MGQSPRYRFVFVRLIDSDVTKVQYSTVWCMLVLGNLSLAIGYGPVPFSLNRFDEINMTAISIYTNRFTHIETLIEPGSSEI